ncbi:uncharacterized protein MONOS_9404 [Monocercomonoides exilis]|uniref:uncharacterized protein n=1 Tax=Monocercomonoides exilis TaxID=2049356 RepID=UPI00355AA5CE|nr:hypothetical protein MONOS_9404 [Monocercomonoides exilis]|eukprot:MONOS_9404.1-p1 / transcript=MONOS_9404.1 / gene=MONOS_9404 / organism=Monocercomonoides_exilis_PA203 / gene_product=unspecified product / transcript_product=unspecified product / location=Mono_scaffold00387:46492-47188(-) / protein_length=190 / sequence_SO=supercontig / SO=protein_coding / is_pseudo=false
MPSVGLLDVHLNCFPLLQQHIPLSFSTSYGFHTPAVLNRVNEANRHRMRNGGGRGKELQGTLRSSACFMTPPRSEEKGECEFKWKKQRRVSQEATERRRRDRGREGWCDKNDDEQQQTFYSLDSALSSAQLHTQNITASSTISTHPFSPLTHTQLSATSVLVGTSPEPLAHSSPATYFSSLAQKSLDIT